MYRGLHAKSLKFEKTLPYLTALKPMKPLFIADLYVGLHS